jgi:hypothetical protein
MNSQPTLTIEQKQPDSGVLPASERFDSKPAQPALVKSTQYVSAAEKTNGAQVEKRDLRDRLAMLDKAAALVHNPAFDDQPLTVRLHKAERIEHCTRRLVANAFAAALVVNSDKGTSSWSNVQRCDLWACPYCGAHKARQELRRLQVGIAEAQRQGFYPMMITLTMRHKRGEKLGEQIDRLYKAKHDMFTGRFYPELRQRLTLLGHNRYTEITVGQNGWHAHLHLLWFAGYEFSANDVAELQDELSPRWLQMLAKVGASGTEERALKVQTADSKVADYLAKFGKLPEREEWGVESELANAPAKRARKDSFTPFELLALATGLPEARAAQFAETFSIEAGQVASYAGALWKEYYAAVKSRQMVSWGAGLLLRFRVDEQVKQLEEAESSNRKRVLWLRDYVALRKDVALYCEVMAAGDAVERVVALLTAASFEFWLVDDGDELRE